MFGTDVVSDWKEGSSIVWKGEWEGKVYEDTGKILKVEKEQMIQYSHFSPLSGQPNLPENYHIVSIELSGNRRETTISLSQDNNTTEGAREHSEKNWQMMLESLKKLFRETIRKNLQVDRFNIIDNAKHAPHLIEMEKK